MILLWLILWFWYDFDMVLIWLIFHALILSQKPYVFSHPHHNKKALSPIPSCTMKILLGPPFLQCVRQHWKSITVNKYGTLLPLQQLHSLSWNMDGCDLKSQAQKNQIIYLCTCGLRLTRIIPVRPCRLFLGSLGTSLWEAWEGKKGAGQLTRMSLILTLGLTCPFSEQNGAEWYWKLTSAWLMASD